MYQPAASPIGKSFLAPADFAVIPISYAGPAYWPISGWRGTAKRAIDIVAALLLLVAAAIPMLAFAAIIRLESPGRSLFRQRRIGFANGSFEIWKFRTMRHHASEPGRLTQATLNDTRVTRFGAFLRRTSLDELPQLFLEPTRLHPRLDRGAVRSALRSSRSGRGPRAHARTRPGRRAGGRRRSR